MTKYYCDRCKKEIMSPIKITIEGNTPCNTEESYEVCTPCLMQIIDFIEKYEYEFPPQTVEAISGVSPV